MTSEQEIFSEAFKMIREAEDIIIVNVFLFHDYTDQDRNFPDLNGKLTNALIEQKQRYPDLQIVFITENSGIITSAHPKNVSRFASNIGFKVTGELLFNMIKAEQAVINYSGGKTNNNILKHLLSEINQAEKSDVTWSGMLHLANRDIFDAFHDATKRGIKVNLILNPNKAAFGNQKTGLPNLPVVSELTKNDNITIRWYESEQDQFHKKLMYIKKRT